LEQNIGDVTRARTGLSASICTSFLCKQWPFGVCNSFRHTLFIHVLQTAKVVWNYKCF